MRINRQNDNFYYAGILITSLSIINLYHNTPIISIILLGVGIGMVLLGYER